MSLTGDVSNHEAAAKGWRVPREDWVQDLQVSLYLLATKMIGRFGSNDGYTIFESLLDWAPTLIDSFSTRVLQPQKVSPKMSYIVLDNGSCLVKCLSSSPADSSTRKGSVTSSAMKRSRAVESAAPPAVFAMGTKMNRVRPSLRRTTWSNGFLWTPQ